MRLTESNNICPPAPFQALPLASALLPIGSDKALNQREAPDHEIWVGPRHRRGCKTNYVGFSKNRLMTQKTEILITRPNCACWILTCVTYVRWVTYMYVTWYYGSDMILGWFVDEQEHNILLQSCTAKTESMGQWGIKWGGRDIWAESVLQGPYKQPCEGHTSRPSNPMRAIPPPSL